VLRLMVDEERDLTKVVDVVSAAGVDGVFESGRPISDGDLDEMPLHGGIVHWSR
jgi:hypothetical protein